jgi:hypothetical protein
MDLHVTELEIVAIVRTIEQLDPRVWRCADTSRPCAFLSENVIRTQSTKVRPQLTMRGSRSARSTTASDCRLMQSSTTSANNVVTQSDGSMEGAAASCSYRRQKRLIRISAASCMSGLTDSNRPLVPLWMGFTPTSDGVYGSRRCHFVNRLVAMNLDGTSDPCALMIASNASVGQPDEDWGGLLRRAGDKVRKVGLMRCGRRRVRRPRPGSWDSAFQRP